MADGDYERRGGREAELKRLARILAEARAAKAAPPVRLPVAPKEVVSMQWKVAPSVLMLLCSLMGGSLSASARTTFVNPLDLDYRLRPETNVCFREAADPEIILQDDRYYLFASKCGGYYVSDNLADWRLIRTTALPTEEYAPTVEAVNGALHYSARKGSVHRAIDPERGIWTRTEGQMLHTCDSALFHDDDGRLYAYWAEDFQGENPIRGCEIDPVTFRDKSPVRLLMEQGVARYGWEVRGERNEQVGGRSYIEGPHMVKRQGLYYLQYAAPGTQFSGYCDTAMMGEGPLGPFRRQRMNPFSFKPTGYVAGAGHGKTFVDRHGNWWHVTTGVIRGVERRIVMFPVFFDPDGEMWCDTAFADWPMRVPMRKVATPEELRTGWMELCVGKKVTASSTAPQSRPQAAVDRDVRTAWCAQTGETGEFLAVDMGGIATVRAIQIGFADAGAAYHGFDAGLFNRFVVEASTDGVQWRIVVDESTSARDGEHPYYELAEETKARHIRVVSRGMPSGKRFALRELRAFGGMEKSRPAQVKGFQVVRDEADRRHVNLSWQPQADVTGYLIRYGVTKEKRHLALVTRGSSAEIRSLDSHEDYHWTICAFNEAGFGEGME